MDNRRRRSCFIPHSLTPPLIHTPPSSAKYPSISPYPNEEALLTDLRGKLAATGKPPPKILVIGALGRCGSGACDFAARVGIPPENIIRWDMAETKAGGIWKKWDGREREREEVMETPGEIIFEITSSRIFIFTLPYSSIF